MDYKIQITLRDQTIVTAHSDMDALNLAEEVFKENGYDITNADLDILEVYEAEYDDSDELKMENM